MIPLRGLAETEKVLASKGMPVTEVEVTIFLPVPTPIPKVIVGTDKTIDSNDFDFYCFSLRGELLPEALEYSTLEHTELQAKTSAAGFFSVKENYYNEFSSDERVILRKYYNFMLYKFYLDGRRRKTWERLQQKIDALFIEHRIEIVTVKIRRITCVSCF